MSKALATKNVAAVLLGLGIVLATVFVFATSANAQTTTTTTTTSTSLSTLQAQVQALLAQIAALQGTGTATSGTGACFTFTENEQQGSSGGQVMWIQEFLNGHGFQVAASGAGSPGNESSYFGALTKAAVIKFQNAYAAQILTPEGLTSGTGNWFAGSRAEANAICASQTTTTTTTTGTGTGTTVGNGTGITVSAAAQPANSLAPQNASRVPFTTFTITNTSGAAVTINGIDVQRTGLANDGAFSGVELIDQNGLQIGTSRTFNSNHQAEIGTPWTLAAGASMTYTVAGNMTANEAAYAGQVVSISVVGIDTSVPVSGTLPITGASQTINASLTIGTATAQRSSYDPLNGRSEPLGTTGLIFSGVRITAGSAEPEKLYSITWNQTGSVGSNDLANLVTVVNGTSYPVTVDSTGKYYSATFPGGISIAEGGSVDAYIQGDLVGSDASGRTVEFDIYRQSDIYLVGQTYGYGVTPSANNNFVAASLQSGTVNNIPSWSSGFIGANSVSAQPFFQGAGIYVTAGTLSTVGNAGSVSSQNIAINVPNQPLGGFTTDFTGEAVQVQSLTFTVASSSGSDQLKSVSIVDGNGNVVAGPVDETLGTGGADSGTLVFNTSVTFPVGSQTYTLKGTVGSNATNGVTYQLSTNPNTEWGSPQGETSGSTVVLPNTTITMSTMTTQAGQLIVSAASTPASTNIAGGSSNFVIANINLNASQSGEDIRLASLPIVVNASSTAVNSATATVLSQLAGDLTNCQLYNNGMPLNNQSIGNSGWSNVVGTGAANSGFIYANFIFQNAITIPKGTVTTLALECNISSNIAPTAVFSAGVNGSSSTYTPSPTGIQSGNTLVLGSGLTVQTSASGTMTPGSASLAAAVDSSSPSYTPVSGGTSNQIISAFNLQPTSDSVNLQNIGLKLNGTYASSSDVMSATLWQGSTQVGGTVLFTTASADGNYYATTTVSGLSIPQNNQTVFTIKANLASVGTGQAGQDGHIVKISLSDAQGTGASSGSTVNSGTPSGTVQGVGLYRAFPSLASVSISTSLTSGTQTLYEFSVTPSSGGNSQGVSLDQVSFQVATSSYSTGNGFTGVNSYYLYAYQSSTCSGSAVTTAAGNGLLNAAAVTNNLTTNTQTIRIPFDNPLTLGAGTTYCFLLQGTVSQTGGTNGAHGQVITYLLGNDSQLTTYPFMVTATVATTTPDNFVWSPNAASSPAAVSAKDWTDSYGLPGLPSTGMPTVTLTN